MKNESYANQLVTKDSFWVIFLLLITVLLYTASLGDLPLRDWDESIVAGVARNIWRAEPGSQTWLYPTINYGAPYWNKPPLIHGLVASSYSLFGISEWSTRIIPACLSACAVPLLYLVARELFSLHITAIFSALVYLTLLPVARHARVAMLDGAISCWFCLGVWCLLRGRQRRQWLLGTGLALGAASLTKGIMMGVLLGGILIVFIFWDCPKLLRSSYLWVGLSLGIVPTIAWYLLQYFHYGAAFLGTSLGNQTFSRIWSSVSTISAPPWYYLLEIAKYSLPWLIFLPHGIKLAYATANSSWSKLTLVWGVTYLLAISLMNTKLPWYVIPFYPVLALLVGVSLSRIWQQQQISKFWQVSLSLVAFVCWLGSIYYGFLSNSAQADLAAVLLTVAIGFSLATLLIWWYDRRFIPVTIGGFYLGLLLLFNSPHWLWELNHSFPVKPVAQLLANTPPRQQIYTNYQHSRPSLEFYSDRVIRSSSNQELEQLWQQQRPVYFLIDSETIPLPRLKEQQVIASSVSWQLITRRN